MFRRVKRRPSSRDRHLLRLEPLEDRLLLSGLTYPLNPGPEPAAAAGRSADADADTYGAGQSRSPAADNSPSPQTTAPAATQGPAGTAATGNKSGDGSYSSPPEQEDRPYYRTPTAPLAAATPANFELPHAVTPPAPGMVVVAAPQGGTPSVPVAVPPTLNVHPSAADTAQATPTTPARHPAEDTSANFAVEPFPTLTETAATPSAPQPAPDWQGALPTPLPLPLDLPPDFRQWAGAAERFFLELDALTRDADGESVWTQLGPWCVALGALSVSLEFARRWLGKRAADLADVTPRGWSWRWSRGAAPWPLEQP